MKYKFISVNNDLNKAIAFANTLDSNYIKDTQRIKQKEFYIPTIDVVQKLQNNGWLINGVDEQLDKNSRKIINNYVHMIHPDFAIKNNKGEDEAFSSVTISNSCSGNQPLQMSLGAYRMVCENGAISYDEHAKNTKIKHNEANHRNIDYFINTLNDKAQGVINKLNTWKQQNMTVDQMQDLARKAAKLRYNEDDEQVDFNALLRVNRVEDEYDDVWTVFNRIQENLTYDVKDKQTDIWLNQQLYNLVDKELICMN
jgi:hypothetical protein